MYVSVILERNGWNRFDYSAFDYGYLPKNQTTDVMVYRCEMNEKKHMITDNSYLLDPSIWYPHYSMHKSKLHDVF